MVERGIPRHDYEIADANGNVVGIVTSGTQSPSMGIAIGMGYVPTALATPDSEIYIRIRNKDIKAKVVKMPFYKKQSGTRTGTNLKIEIDLEFELEIIIFASKF